MRFMKRYGLIAFNIRHSQPILFVALQFSRDPLSLAFTTVFSFSQVPSTIYLWPMVAFATTVLLNVLSSLFEQRAARKQLCFLAAYISGVAFVYEFLAWYRVAPIYVTASGRPNSLLRYVMWGHATPAMLYTLSLISEFTLHQVLVVIGVDVFMIATAIPGELIPHWTRWIWNAASCAAFPYIFLALWQMYTDAIDGAGESDRAAQGSLRALRGFTVTFWSVFPMIWALVQAQVVSIRTEELLWSLADICGKIFFSTSLLHGNFMTIDARRLLAMRVVEEANRVKVIHELKQLVEQKENFIALMSHELRTPLNGIIGLSNTLLMDLPADDTIAKTLATIRNSGARLLHLINDILDAAAIRKGKLVVARNRLLLSNSVDDVIELTGPLVKPGVVLSNRISSDIPPITGDASRLVQILYNLVGNACKFTEHGEIWVDAEVINDGDGVAVSVHDTGIGIPREKQQDIFSPFEQVDMSARRQYGGTGLGLNLAKQLIEAHGGTIMVASKPGIGSTFTFTLKTWRPSRSSQSVSSSALLKSAKLGSPRSSAARGAGDDSLAHPAKPAEGRQFRISWPRSEQHGQKKKHGTTSKEGFNGEEVKAEALPTQLGADESINLVPEKDNGNNQMRRNPSARDLVMRLDHDSDPANMLQRLSIDAALRHSYEAEKNLATVAPQQLEPSVAASIFLQASSPSNSVSVSNLEQRSVDAMTTNTKEELDIKSQDSHSHLPSLQPPSPKPSSCMMKNANWMVAAKNVAAAERSGVMSVLSVDDDPINQMVVQAMLRRAGFKVFAAGNGMKALDMLEESITAGTPPDLLLLDVMMPELSGYDVARIIRERYPSLMLPIILVSANGHEDQVVEGLQAGANDYITKPYGHRELIARILTQLRTKSFAEAAISPSFSGTERTSSSFEM